MSQDRSVEPATSTSDLDANRRKSRRLQTGVRSLIALVISCGIVFWAARPLWESQHPAIAAARRLRASSPAARVGAVRELMDLGVGDGEIAIAPLIVALADTETAVRVAAAEALSMFGSEAVKSGADDHQVRAAVAALCESLSDRQPEVRSAAANAVGMIARCDRAQVLDLGPAAATLVAMLDDRNTEVHRAVVGAIGFVGPGALIDPPSAIVAALDDESAQQRSDAVDALVNFTRGLPRLIPSLLRSMEKARPEARPIYVRLLGKIEPPQFSAEVVPPFIDALESHDPEIRYLSVLRLAAFKAGALEAVPALIKLFRGPIDVDLSAGENLPGNRMIQGMPFATARALGQIAPGTDQAGQVVAALTEALRSGRPECRASAAEALGSFGPAAEPAVPVLIAALRKAVAIEKPMALVKPNGEWNYDGPFLVADWSARSLGKIAPGTLAADDVLAALIGALQSKSFGTPHIPVMMAVAEFGPKARSAIPRLHVLQKDPNQQIRGTATYALQRVDR
jgi:HEAT repeat protein